MPSKPIIVITFATRKPVYTITARLNVAKIQPMAGSQVLHSATPSTEWNTLDYVITFEIPADNPGKPWIWLQNLKEHYVGASTLMEEDWYYFWVKMSEADKASISAWETTICTVLWCWSFGTNTNEFMRNKFQFGLKESSSHFQEDIFHWDSQRKPEDPISPWNLWWGMCLRQSSFKSMLQAVV